MWSRYTTPRAACRRGDRDSAEARFVIPCSLRRLLTDDERFLLIYNFTPAQSVSVVDIGERKFVGEVETAGCALVYPTGRRSFFSICSDGALLVMTLDGCR